MPVFSGVSFFTWLLAEETSIVYSDAIARMRKDRAAELAWQGLVAALVLSGILGAVTVLLKNPYLAFMGPDASTMAFPSDYWKWYPVVVFQESVDFLLLYLVYADGGKWSGLISYCGQVVSNVGLSYGLCRGACGLPATGMSGISFGTACAYLVGIAVLMPRLLDRPAHSITLTALAFFVLSAALKFILGRRFGMDGVWIASATGPAFAIGGILPGNFAEDIRRMASFMRLVIDDLSKDGLVDVPEISIVGWSMGGLFTAYLVELESKGELGFKADNLLAINLPVDFNHVISTVEDFMEPSRSWSREQALEKFLDVAPRLLVWDELQFAPTPDITEEDARYTVAASLVATLPELVARTTQDAAPISARDYLDRYVQNAASKSESADSAKNDGMKTLDDVFRGNTHFAAIHTWDDFLLRAADRDYLDSTLGDRITWFSSGAHCGMFYTPEFKQEVLLRLNLADK